MFYADKDGWPVIIADASVFFTATHTRVVCVLGELADGDTWVGVEVFAQEFQQARKVNLDGKNLDVVRHVSLWARSASFERRHAPHSIQMSICALYCR